MCWTVDLNYHSQTVSSFLYFKEVCRPPFSLFYRSSKTESLCEELVCTVKRSIEMI